MPEFKKEDGEASATRVWYELFLLNKDKTEYHLAACLTDPHRPDMFWFSYLIEPVSEEMDARLRDESIWNESNYMLQRPGHPIPPPDWKLDWTFSGRWVEYCERKTNRMSFRSLPPTTDEDATLWGIISDLGRGICNLFKRDDFWGPPKPPR